MRWQPAAQPAGAALARYAHASPDYAQKLAQTLALLQHATAQYQPITLACSLGAEDMVLLHLLHQHQLPCEVFVLNTGQLNTQTLDLLTQVQNTYGKTRAIHIYHPDTEQTQILVAQHGDDLMRQSLELRQTCCHVRKMLPLGQALQGKRAWITGLRREQSAARAEVPLQQDDGTHADGAGGVLQREKFNPLAQWTWGDVWHYIQAHAVPYNALHDDFYPSIGCAPCTRSVTLGEDFRAGRWWWEQSSAKECGLHVK